MWLLVTCMVWQAWLPLLVRMAETACRILPVSPQDTTRLKRQAQDRAVMACPVGSLVPVLRTVVSNSSWKSDSERGAQGHAVKNFRSLLGKMLARRDNSCLDRAGLTG